MNSKLVECEFCHRKVKNFVIGQTDICGKWATMCYDCFQNYGVGLGQGIGCAYAINEKTGQHEKIVDSIVDWVKKKFNNYKKVGG